MGGMEAALMDLDSAWAVFRASRYAVCAGWLAAGVGAKLEVG